MYTGYSSGVKSTDDGGSDIRCEQALLGVLLADNGSYQVIKDIVSQKDFSTKLHRAIFRVCAEKIKGGKEASPLTIKRFFKGWSDVNPGVSVPQYLFNLPFVAVEATDLTACAQVVKDLGQYRRELQQGEN